MKTQTELKDLYNYDPDTGILTSKRWGKPVGTRRSDGLTTRFGRVHRLIWVWMTNDELGTDVIDHINGDPFDNRWSNLRRCTRAQNQLNRSANSNNTSGYKGVTWVERTNLWQAAIGFQGTIYYLGQYESADEAYDVYLEEAERLFGEYNREDYVRV